ncbi:DUF1559 domain-containing protein [Aureliella helgolandensis]|uniref:DUF1559 domain-containing protein n=1 Tax=Aureliella helgolandensis TaxID=2527968 RepID=A0A518G2S4_9BACT|nr:DUF1559 domain-containing protein [Aureliella helgolandensis]QDV22894.1 hypothetical protein Q31a_11870 [Aureliella helgolandensis]
MVHHPNRTQARQALTLIETVASISIIGILAAILIPAVQAVRESARKAHCQDNLKQIALATHAFHNANNALPSFYNGTSLPFPLQEWDLFHTHSWRATLLPHLEQTALRESIAWDSLATSLENEPVATTVVPPYVCPSGTSPTTNMGWVIRYGSMSVPEPNRTEADICQVVRSDYDAMAGILVIPDTSPSGVNPYSTKFVRWGVWGWPDFDNNAISGGKLLRYRPGKFRDISDGLSNTIMLVERGGRPIHLVDGRPKATPDNPDAVYLGQTGWSASNTFVWAINGHNVGINQDNATGIYSSHAGGAYIALADGSVSFLTESTDFHTLARMFGRSDGDR